MMPYTVPNGTVLNSHSISTDIPYLTARVFPPSCFPVCLGAPFKGFIRNWISAISAICLILSSGFPVYGLDTQGDIETYSSDGITCVQNSIVSISSYGSDYMERDTTPWVWFRRIFKPNKKTMKKESTRKATVDRQALLPDNHGYLKDIPCVVAFKGFDPVLQKSKKELTYQHLFSHTHPELKSYLPGQELLKAEGRLTRMDGGYLYLSLKFIWSANNPQKFYGNFKNKNPVDFRLSQDKQITLYNSTSADWQAGTDGNHYVLTALYSIHPKQAQLFRKYFVMSMRIYWERGYQDYPVYNIGMIKDQVECLD